MDRRRFLSELALALSSASLSSLASPARALGPSSRVRLHVLDVGGQNERALSGARVLAGEIRYRTSIDVAEEPVLVRITDPRFPTQALAILAGAGSFSLSVAERAALSRWISLGGFLWIDNGGPDVHSASFDRSVRRELGAIFPGRAMERVSADHVLYRSFYRLDYPAGRAIHRPYVEGLTLGPRLGVVLNHNDLLGALERPPGGAWVSRPEPGGESQREMAIRFGVNATMYGLCQHYKDDQVHLDYLLHRRKWRIRQTGNP